MPNELKFYSLFLMIFILINIVLYFFIQIRASERIFRKLFFYWLSIFIVFIFEGIFTEGKLALSLVFFTNFLPILLMTNFLLELFDKKLDIKFFIKALPVAVLANIVLYQLNFPFFIVALPALIINSLPILYLLYAVHMADSKDKLIEKMMVASVSYIGLASCIYYALFRFNPTELQYFIGFGSAFISYLICSILLPLLCIQMINRKRTEVLRTEVAERTRELSKSKQEKEELLRVLVHDISNPLQTIMLQIRQLKKNIIIPEECNYSIEKMSKNVLTIKEIISYVREYESILSGKKTIQLRDVLLSECLQEMQDLFAESFAAKNVGLNIINWLPPETLIKVDKTPFIHSVTSNLISNALKFSKPNSDVYIFAHEEDERIVIEIIDQGIGISKDHLNSLFDISLATSRTGTLGEIGTGFGLPIVMAYTKMFNGEIIVQSSEETDCSGTNMALYLPKIQAESAVLLH